MQCPKCQHDNRDQAQFCEGCGTRLVLKCAECGTELGPSARFCSECGAPATAPSAIAPSPTSPPTSRFTSPQSYTPAHLAERIISSRGALEGERKQVTVLFSVLQDRRRALHARIADAIEALYPDRLAEHLERLAQHARGEVWEKAVSYLQQAGVKAQGRSAYREAVTALEQALSAVAHLPDSRETRERAIDLRFDLRPALFPLGEYTRIAQCPREAESMAERLGDERRLGRALAFLAQHLLSQGEFREGISTGERALAISMTLGDPRMQVTTSIFLGRAVHSLGEYRRSAALAQAALACLDGSDLASDRLGLVGFPAITSRSILVLSLLEQGELAEGLAHAQEALRIADRLDHPLSLAIAYYYVGHANLVLGDLEQAISALERAVEISQANSVRFLTPVAATDLGHAYALCSRLPDALRMLEQAAGQVDLSMQGFSKTRALVSLGRAYLVLGRREDAHEIAGRAMALAQDCQERGNEAWTSALLGEIAAHGEPQSVEQAESHYHQALALADELGMRPLVAHCHLGLGTLYQKIGRGEQAQVELTAAAEMYRGMEMAFWLDQQVGRQREQAAADRGSESHCQEELSEPAHWRARREQER
jgi:tetratricopeptide (TPR) repeat protein